MQTIYLYDQIIMEKKKEPGIEISTNLFYLPLMKIIWHTGPPGF